MTTYTRREERRREAIKRVLVYAAEHPKVLTSVIPLAHGYEIHPAPPGGRPYLTDRQGVAYYVKDGGRRLVIRREWP